jgi:hypothetical protein
MPANFTTGGFAFLSLSLVCQHSPTPATATAAAVPPELNIDALGHL